MIKALLIYMKEGKAAHVNFVENSVKRLVRFRHVNINNLF
jgi:hypothetical protein